MSYDVFLSYSHAGDRAIASAIQRALQAFAKRWTQRRAVSVFRDQTGLSANPTLWSSVARALDTSSWFVLLASPEAAQSDWVDREVGHWCEHGTRERLLIVQTGGEIAWDREQHTFDVTRTTALPPALRGVFSEEPLWVDMRWARSDVQLSLRNPQFRDAIADLSASIRGIKKDDLIGEDIREHRKAVLFRRIVITGLALATITLAVVAVVALQQKNLAQQNRVLANQKAAEALSHAAAARRNADEARHNQQQAEDARGVAEERRRTAVARLASASAIYDFQLGDPTHLEDDALLIAEALRRESSLSTDQSARSLLNLLSRTIWTNRHPHEINTVAFSPDDRYVVTGSADGIVRIFDAHTGKYVSSLPLAGGKASFAFSGDGRWLAAIATPCGTVTLFPDRPCAARANAKSLGTNSAADESSVHVYAAGSWTESSGLAVDHPTRVALDRDGDRLAVVSLGKIAVYDRTPQGWRSVTEPIAPSHSQDALFDSVLALSPDGGRIATAFASQVEIINVASGARLRPIPPNDRAVVAVSFNYNGSLFAVGSLDSTASIYDTSNWSRGHVWKHDRDVTDVAFSLDGSRLATAGADRIVNVWNVESGKAVARVVVSDEVGGAALNGSGRLVGITVGRMLSVADVRGGEVARWDLPVENVQKAVFSPTGDHVAVADKSVAWILPVRNTRQPLTFKFDPAGTFRTLTFSDNGRYIAGAGDHGAVVMDLVHRRAVTRVPVPATHQIVALAFSFDARYVATRDTFGNIRITDVSADKQVQHWTLDMAQGPLALSSDGALLAIGDILNGVHLFDRVSGKRLRVLPHTDHPSVIAFSRAGKYIAVARDGAHLTFFEVATGRELKKLEYTGTIGDVYFAADDRHVVVATDSSPDHPTRVLDVAGGWREISRVPHRAPALVGPLTEGGRYLLTASAEHSQSISVHRHPIYPEDLINEICSRLKRNLTRSTWSQIFGDEPYVRTCPRLPEPATTTTAHRAKDAGQ